MSLLSDLTPMTELEAVNQMMLAIGEPPVNSLEMEGGDEDQLSEAGLALSVLKSISRHVQAEGLHCNTVENYELHPENEDKTIPVPANALSVRSLDRDTDVIVHKGKLYTKTGFKKKFTKPVTCEIVFMLDFEDLPEYVRQYITIRAARIFQKRMLGSGQLHDMTEEEEIQARVNMRSREVENEQHNALDGYRGTVNRYRRGVN